MIKKQRKKRVTVLDTFVVTINDGFCSYKYPVEVSGGNMSIHRMGTQIQKLYRNVPTEGEFAGYSKNKKEA